MPVHRVKADKDANMIDSSHLRAVADLEIVWAVPRSAARWGGGEGLWQSL